jgi:hypothetical protein
MIKIHKGKFVKRDGKIRHMVFARIDDLPSTFVASKIVGAGKEQQYPDGMELVWDMEADNFRVFNWNTSGDDVSTFELDDSLFN